MDIFNRIVGVSIFLSSIQRRLEGRFESHFSLAIVANFIVESYISSLGQSMNEAYRKTESALSNEEKADDVIFAIQLVKGIQFYGYHNKFELFLKVYVRV